MPVTHVQETCTRSLHVYHSDSQQDISWASFLHSCTSFLREIEHVLFAVLVQVFCTSIIGIRGTTLSRQQKYAWHSIIFTEW